MKLPNWFKILWWILLTGILSAFLYSRYPELIAGKAVPADIVVFVIWIALLLAPLFNEVSLLGITLKQQIEELKGFVATQVSDIRSEVRTAIDMQTTISPHFNLNQPVTDSQLPELGEQIKAWISEGLAAHGIDSAPSTSTIIVPDDVSFLFATRYNIENELRRIAGEHSYKLVTGKIYTPLGRILRGSEVIHHLADMEIIEQHLATAIYKIYDICTYAIHGVTISAAQVSFVKDVAPPLVAALKTIKK